jgi:hypothetical protein
VTTRWRARALDAQLARGADPIQSSELSLRAGQLGSAKNRRRMACAFRGLVGLAERGAYPIALAAPPIRRTDVRANRELLLELADRLCSSEPAGAQGLAIASRLISDRTSPLYSARSDRPLPVTAFEALVAMDRRLRAAGRADG